MTEGKGIEAGKTVGDFNPSKKPKRNKYAFGCAILASMTSILLGYGESYFLYYQTHLKHQIVNCIGEINIVCSEGNRV